MLARARSAPAPDDFLAGGEARLKHREVVVEEPKSSSSFSTVIRATPVILRRRSESVPLDESRHNRRSLCRAQPVHIRYLACTCM